IAAMAILLYSIQFISKRKLVPFIITVLFAMGFHKTAILFLPVYFLYFLYGTSKYKTLKILSFSVLIILMINFSTLLFPIVDNIDALSYYADSYLDSDREFE